MAQDNFDIPVSQVSGSFFRDRVRSGLLALNTNNSGPIRPETLGDGVFHINTAGTDPSLDVYFNGEWQTLMPNLTAENGGITSSSSNNFNPGSSYTFTGDNDFDGLTDFNGEVVFDNNVTINNDLEFNRAFTVDVEVDLRPGSLLVDTLAQTDDSQRAASTAYVRQAISNVSVGSAIPNPDFVDTQNLANGGTNIFSTPSVPKLFRLILICDTTDQEFNAGSEIFLTQSASSGYVSYRTDSDVRVTISNSGITVPAPSNGNPLTLNSGRWDIRCQAWF